MRRAISISWLAVLAGVAFPSPAAPVPAAEVLEVSIMELTQVDWDPGKRLPRRIAALDGKQVRIAGFMAIDTEEGASVFRLTYDQCGCANAKASHFVEVRLSDGTVGYDPDEITVVGTFAVGEEREDGFVKTLYRLAAESLD